MNAIGVDIGGSSLKAGVITDSGQILHQCIIPIDRFDTPNIIREVVTLVKDYQQRFSIATVGIASTGVVNTITGEIIQSTTIKDYDGTNWKRLIREVCHLPIVVENDSRAATWGEFKHTALPPTSTMSLITVGSGVGSGLIIEGKLWRGASGASGEIGYMTIQADGAEYNGNVGCLEPKASGLAIVAYVHQKILAGYSSNILELVNHNTEAISLPIIIQAAHMDDRLAQEALQFAGEMLGVGIVNLVHILNPHTVILGGGDCRSIRYLYQCSYSVGDETHFALCTSWSYHQKSATRKSSGYCWRCSLSDRIFSGNSSKSVTMRGEGITSLREQ